MTPVVISIPEVRAAQSDARLTLKTQDHTLIRQAMEGAGLTRWEAQSQATPRSIHLSLFP